VDPIPGQRISDAIRLKTKIAEGGMSTIWMAEDVRRKRDVAVKILAPDLCGWNEAVERFGREASAVARLQSPHVPRVFGTGSLVDGTPFIVLELLDGVNLDSYVRRRGPLPLSRVVRIVTQLASAVREAHAEGIIHRDIKPENIFLTGSEAEPYAKLLDFGVAKLGRDRSSQVTHRGAVLGTPCYMSPEQLVDSSEVTESSDLWSLSVVAYVALTGRLPFYGETFAAVCMAVHDGCFAPPSSIRPELPSAVDRWFFKALNRDVRSRFRDANEFAQALRVAAEAPVARRRHTFVVAAAAAVLGLLAVSDVCSHGAPAEPMPIASSVP
jgi:eukaryotic-like serine/threonine-protein kinase